MDAADAADNSDENQVCVYMSLEVLCLVYEYIDVDSKMNLGKAGYRSVSTQFRTCQQKLAQVIPVILSCATVHPDMMEVQVGGYTILKTIDSPEIYAAYSRDSPLSPGVAYPIAPQRVHAACSNL